MSDFQKSVDAPYIVVKNGVEVRFPPLKLKSYGTLLEKIRSDFISRLEKIASKQKLSNLQTAEFLSKAAVPDYGPDHIFQWVWSWDGAMAIVKESLMTSGKTFAEIETILSEFTPEEVVITGLEIIRHDARPSNRTALAEQVKKAAEESEKKTAE